VILWSWLPFAPYDAPRLALHSCNLLTCCPYVVTQADEGEGGVLGLNVLAGYDILFDIDNDRIGFAKADCPTKVHEEDVLPEV
jgi:hypothetical protein